MKTRRPIGITVFILTGILCGGFWSLFGIVLLAPKSNLFFVDITGVPSHKYYINSLIFFVMGIAFLTSSIMLLKRKGWSKMFFLLVLLSNAIIEIRIFVTGMEFNKMRGVSPIILEDVIELAIALALPLIAFWYFNRKNVQNYLTIKNHPLGNRVPRTMGQK
jgi:glucose dehydrogenase